MATTKELAMQVATDAGGNPEIRTAAATRLLELERDATVWRTRALALAEGILDAVDEPPPRNCSCHIAPPCNDCVENSYLREIFATARAAVEAANGQGT